MRRYIQTVEMAKDGEGWCSLAGVVGVATGHIRSLQAMRVDRLRTIFVPMTE